MVSEGRAAATLRGQGVGWMTYACENVLNGSLSVAIYCIHTYCTLVKSIFKAGPDGACL
jgi:hypothetical protein